MNTRRRKLSFGLLRRLLGTGRVAIKGIEVSPVVVNCLTWRAVMVIETSIGG